MENGAKSLRYGGVVRPVSHFDDLTRVVMVVKVISKTLLIRPCSSSQKRLFDRVFLLRERDPWPFEAIANLLKKSCTRPAMADF
jgi:hypothetical protein